MYSPITLAKKYLKYYLSALNSRGHGTHSPFVFNLITRILNDKTVYPDYRNVEMLRKKLIGNSTPITIVDMGAGSGHSKSAKRTIASIARHAAKPKKYAQLLYRITKYYKPKVIIELGTSLGVTTSYLALANPEAIVYSLEGAPEVAAVAKQSLFSRGIKNVEIIVGNFDDTLGPLLKRVGPPDLVFIDGNHRKDPTMRYFNQVLGYLSNDTIMIFDDIHWSLEMEESWKEIRRQESVRTTIDLFFIGIVLFRREFREKQHFTIRF